MRLPPDFLLPEDIEDITALMQSVDALAVIFTDTPEEATTEALHMAAATFRAGADRLETIASRVEKTTDDRP